MTDTGFVFPGGMAWSLPPWAMVVLQVGTFSLKTFLVGCFMIHVRWTLPRFRYDQLMAFGWKFLLPLAALNLTATAVVRWMTL
jgi:NADH-quinone oxidoreductase subunit H